MKKSIQIILWVGCILLPSALPVKAATQVDLAVDLLVTAGPGGLHTFVPGQDIGSHLLVLVWNNGPGTTPPTTGAVYLSSDRVITSSDQRLGNMMIPALKPDESRDISVSGVTLPVGTPVGELFMGVIVDDNNNITETNEMNNAVESGFKVATGPDLVPDLDKINHNFLIICRGDNFANEIDFTISNIGNAPTAPFDYEFYLSDDPIIDSSDTPLVNGKVTMSSPLAPFSFGTVPIPNGLDFPPGIKEGIYFLGVLLDIGQSITEVSEINNYASLVVLVCNPISPVIPPVQPLGPIPYLGFSPALEGVGDAFSPFFELHEQFEFFFLEDFEDVELNTPGVSVGRSIIGSNTQANDSVDADDGEVDGFGQKGGSIFDQEELAFEFTADVLEGLPTHVGVVVTDSHPEVKVRVEFFGPGGDSIGVNETIFGDGDFHGGTGEDRFFGMIAAGGISKVLVTDLGAPNGFEIDHLQYGRMEVSNQIPESSFNFGNGAVSSGEGVIVGISHDDFGRSLKFTGLSDKNTLSIALAGAGEFEIIHDPFTFQSLETSQEAYYATVIHTCDTLTEEFPFMELYFHKKADLDSIIVGNRIDWDDNPVLLIPRSKGKDLIKIQARQGDIASLEGNVSIQCIKSVEKAGVIQGYLFKLVNAVELSSEGNEPVTCDEIYFEVASNKNSAECRDKRIDLILAKTSQDEFTIRSIKEDPGLQLKRLNDGTVNLKWIPVINQAHKLQVADRIDGPFIDASEQANVGEDGVSTIAITITGDHKFFRLFEE